MKNYYPFILKYTTIFLYFEENIPDSSYQLGIEVIEKKK